MQKPLPLKQNLLTIAIPSYNGSEHFAELFKSIELLGLTHDEYEVLVIDNCSNDNTQAVLADLQRSMSNLRFYKNQLNIGRIENWNLALALCQGEFLLLMNVNDRFSPFDMHRNLDVLKNNSQVTMVFADYEQKGSAYPNWAETGYFKLGDYIRTTFLNEKIFEFYSLGILHQHIFRTGIIRENNIYFDPKIPRTTDRVFVGEVASAGGGWIYYFNNSMVEWRLNASRYHYTAHINKHSFNLQELWLNEYEANLRLSEMVSISKKDFLKSQLMLADRYLHKNWLYRLRKNLKPESDTREGLEFITAKIYFEYVKAICKMNGIRFNYSLLTIRSLIAVFREFLIFHKFLKKNRSLKKIIRNVPL